MEISRSRGKCHILNKFEVVLCARLRGGGLDIAIKGAECHHLIGGLFLNSNRKRKSSAAMSSAVAHDPYPKYHFTQLPNIQPITLSPPFGPLTSTS